MFQDELSGVGLILTVVHIHLELISLNRRNNTSTLLTSYDLGWKTTTLEKNAP